MGNVQQQQKKYLIRNQNGRMCKLTNPLNSPDLLEIVFSNLAPVDIKSAALVSRTWNSVIEAAKFWSWAQVTLTSENFSEIFPSYRFRSVSSVTLSFHDKLSDGQLKELFSNFSKLPDLKLKHLDICHNDLSSIKPSVLSQAVVRLEEVWLFWTELTGQQVEDIFHLVIKAGAEGRLRLRSLYISQGNVSLLSPSVIQQVNEILHLFVY